MTEPSSPESPSEPDAPDTDPLLAQNPFGASWGSGGWGAGYAGPTAPGAAEPATPWLAPTPVSGRAARFIAPKRADEPVLGDVELPAAQEPFSFPSPSPNTGSGNAGRAALVGLGGLAALAAAGGLVFWLMNRPASEPDTKSPSAATTLSTTTTTQVPTKPAVRDPAAEAQLLRSLPPGYPPDACRPVAPDPGGVAAVDCAKNLDPGGPTAASFVVTTDRSDLDAALTAAIGPSDIVVCPGNIQSPGAWRRNATPDQVAGTLVCGMPGNVPTVAWSDFGRQVVSVVRADPPGSGLDQLYQWWASHS